MHQLFISSTFRDMQAERDLLHREVLPLLNERALAYGDSLGMVDLRWGVDTLDLDGEAGARHVLSVCLDEIDRCRPWMLVFLGDRYGWIPDGALLAETASEKGLTLEDMERSVTALEIEYGALSDPAGAARCLFFLRRPLPYDRLSDQDRSDYMAEGPEDAARLVALKDRIRQFAGDRVCEYDAGWDPQNRRITGLETLCGTLVDRLTRLLLPEWEASGRLSWQDRERMQMEMLLSERLHRPFMDASILDRCIDGLDGDACDLLLLGSTEPDLRESLLAALAHRLRMQGHTVFVFLCGESGRSDDLADFYRQLHHFLELETGRRRTLSLDEDPALTIGQLRHETLTLLHLAGISRTTGRLVLMLDAFERFHPHPFLSTGQWLPEGRSRMPHVQFLIGAASDAAVPLRTAPTPTDTLHMTRLEITAPSRDALRIGMEGALQDAGKQLSARVVDVLLTKPGAVRPVWISLMLRRLVMMDQSDFMQADALAPGAAGLEQRMLALIAQSPDDPALLGEALLAGAAHAIAPEACLPALRLLAVSRYGLRLDDLVSLLHRPSHAWSQLDFLRFVRYLHNWFLQRPDGRIDFSHRELRAGLLHAIGTNDKALHAAILAHLANLPPKEPLVAEEALHHARGARDAAFLLELLARIEGPIRIRYPDRGMSPHRYGVETLRLADDLARQVLADDAEWLCGVLGSDMPVHLSPNHRLSLCQFLAGPLFEAFDTPLRTTGAAVRLYELLTAMADRLAPHGLEAVAANLDAGGEDVRMTAGDAHGQWMMLLMVLPALCGRLCLARGLPERAMAHFQRAEAVLASVVDDPQSPIPRPDLRRTGAAIHRGHGVAAMAAGQDTIANQYFGEVLGIRQATLADEGGSLADLDALAEAWLDLSDARHALGDEDGAWEAAVEALSAFEAPIPDPEPPQDDALMLGGQPLDVSGEASIYRREQLAVHFQMIDGDVMDEPRGHSVASLFGQAPQARSIECLLAIAGTFLRLGRLMSPEDAMCRNILLYGQYFAYKADERESTPASLLCLAELNAALADAYKAKDLRADALMLLENAVRLGRSAAEWAEDIQVRLDADRLVERLCAPSETTSHGPAKGL